ncbi:scarecrow-like protein 15 [Pistacia vera]|uniref:scarecrow-like protein 15 n=1 Tax=Pistacia vera TaxID=55513 RepID=UPI00126339BC|nr:scarecrow-like protein 15 [Pistacia vera]XP_031257635.1 scarecrow-like protein 15 [Pistacia vera]
MRVPVKPTQNNNPKPAFFNTSNIAQNISFGTNQTNRGSNSCYEPTSVLDLRRSPSPEKPATATDTCTIQDPPPPEWEEHVMRAMDWDSIMTELGLDDDSVPTFKCNPQLPRCEPQIQQQFTEFTSCQPLDSTPLLHSDFNFNVPDINLNQNQSFSNFEFPNNFQNTSANLNVGFDCIEELIRAADCFDSNELQLAQRVLARLNQKLKLPVGKPLQRAAFFFKEALNSLLIGSTRPTRLSSISEIIQSIRAYKAFSGISPIPMFTQFTSNQALLESLEGSPPLVHIIDFDIGFGGQYASFMRELAEKAQSCNKMMNPTSLRITAIVPEEYVPETRLIKDILILFAQDLRIRFQIEFVLVRTFEMLSFKAVKFMDGERIAVVLSPTIFRRLGTTNNAVGFVNDVRRLSPSVVVFVDNEGWTESGATLSFRRNFVNYLEYYSMVFESLDAAMGSGEWARKIEMYLLKPKITGAVEGALRRVAPWRELFSGAGMRPVHLSQFADFQAECLLGRVQVRGFQVAKRQAELVLCWHQWALVATSVWRC